MNVYLLSCTSIVLFFVCRYLGLFGDHIVSAVLHSLHCYTQDLLYCDLINSTGKPLVISLLLEAVDCFDTFVVDTSHAQMQLTCFIVESIN
jgi:hypothetical protein